MKYTITDFRKDYSTENQCLDRLFQLKYGKLEACPSCGVVNAKFKRVPKRRSYWCTECNHQLYPTAGTVFEKTTTPLTHWFYAIFLFTTTRNGLAAKELERQLGVTYKTAWRMAKQIRVLMSDGPIEMLTGEVIIDETFIGGQERFKHKHKRSKVPGYTLKVPVFGMMEKNTNKIITKVMQIDQINKEHLVPIIRKNIHKDSTIVTDGFGAYRAVGKEFKQHEVLNHEVEEYVRNGFTTNNIEGFWSSLKRTIRGTHIHVSHKYLPLYVGENSFRYMNKDKADTMFNLILKKVS
jgi:transposase